MPDRKVVRFVANVFPESMDSKVFRLQPEAVRVTVLREQLHFRIPSVSMHAQAPPSLRSEARAGRIYVKSMFDNILYKPLRRAIEELTTKTGV